MPATADAVYPSVRALLAAAIKERASDIHCAVGAQAVLRCRGELRRLSTPVLTADGMQSLLNEIQEQWGLSRIQTDLQLQGASDFALEEGGTRFRGQIFRERGGYALALRRLPKEFVPLDKLLLPQQFIDLVQRPRGLILVTGPTGSGKTTTLATLLKHLTETQALHVVTIEDPIEYLLDHGKGVLSQREVPTHAPTFTDALNQALREDPDVIMLGEMRKTETIEVALRAAETGHLVLATLHTSSAAKTVDRIVEVFPAEVRDSIRVQLSMALLGVVSQTLLPARDGKGVVVASEVMTMTLGIAHKIRQGETHKLKSDLQTGARLGMRTLDDHLHTLAKGGQISQEEAIGAAADPDEMRRKFNFENLGSSSPKS